MDNYEAISKMSLEELEIFLDNVYLTGLNNGMYASKLPDNSTEQNALLDENPYDKSWLNAEAEDATRCVIADDEDCNLPEALTKAIFHNAGISMDATESRDKNG